MARKGTTITNPATGESITWIETAADTNGDRLVFDFAVRPGGKLPVVHLHPRQSEVFEVTHGRFWVRVGQEVLVLEPGARATIAPGTPHTWWNEGSETARMHVTFEPALNTETFLEQFCGLANDGRTAPDGTPSFLQIMAMANRYELYVAGPPIVVQRVLSVVLGSVARLLGLRAFYPAYSPDA